MKRIGTLPESPKEFWDRIVAKMSDIGHSYESLLYAHQMNRMRFNRTVAICQELLEIPHEFEIVLEIGCAEGYLTEKLVAMFPVVWGVDFCEALIEKATERVPEAIFACEDIETWQPSCTFDLIVASELIEHLFDIRGEMERWHGFGKALLVTAPICEVEPNERAFDDKLFLREERIADASGHVWYFDGLDDLVNVLKEAGWEIMKAERIGRSGIVLCG